jgi:hypothetical protein
MYMARGQKPERGDPSQNEGDKMTKFGQDNFVCSCGNNVMGSGFYTANILDTMDGGVVLLPVSPDVHGWDADTYYCGDCNEVYSLATGESKYLDVKAVVANH